MKRIQVSHTCAVRCPSCLCPERPGTPPSLDDALAEARGPEVTLGGGDATAWPALWDFLAANEQASEPKRVWIEAPAARLTPEVLARLAAAGAHGVSVQIEALGEEMVRYLRVGDGEKAIADAEAVGLQTLARAVVRPSTFRMVVPLARRLFPRRVQVEVLRQDWGRAPQTLEPAVLEQALLDAGNLELSANRARGRGYLPPCTMPRAWSVRQPAWRNTFREDDSLTNAALPACATCALSERCQFDDVEALEPAVRESIEPVKNAGRARRTTDFPVPEVIVRKRPKPEVICTTPWTTMEVINPDGLVRQCCSQWMHGDLGDVHDASLIDLWNGEGYRRARRVLSSDKLDSLCRGICPRLHDQKFAERTFRIKDGSQGFVNNQLLIAEEIAERREVVKSMPLWLVLCPSSYCNYDCIMCLNGRTSRQDLPDHVWDELPAFLPTLQTLTLQGGEPLANPRTWEFLRKLDYTKYPDASVDMVTNGSLLTESALARMDRCAFGDITISVNAGTAQVYEKVQRGTVSFEQLLQNIDALIRFRDSRPWWFGITLSFVAQPAATPTLLEFGLLAHQRNLAIRLLPLNVTHVPELDFYSDPDQVAKVVEDLDRFLSFCRRVRPEWVREVMATREGVLQEAGARHQGRALVALGTRPGMTPVIP